MKKKVPICETFFFPCIKTHAHVAGFDENKSIRFYFLLNTRQRRGRVRSEPPKSGSFFSSNERPACMIRAAPAGRERRLPALQTT